MEMWLPVRLRGVPLLLSDSQCAQRRPRVTVIWTAVSPFWREHVSCGRHVASLLRPSWRYCSNNSPCVAPQHNLSCTFRCRDGGIPPQTRPDSAATRRSNVSTPFIHWIGPRRLSSPAAAALRPGCLLPPPLFRQSLDRHSSLLGLKSQAG